MVITNSALDKVRAITVIINTAGELEYVSPAVSNILGYSTEELKGTGWEDILLRSEGEVKTVRHLIDRTMDLNREISELNYEKELVASNGEKVWVSWNFSRESEGKVIGIGYDITRQKRIEQQLEQQKEYLKEQQEEMFQGIRYAQRLQEAILPDPSSFQSEEQDLFVYYQAKDRVSGDFYFFHRNGDQLFVAAVDCTGHGVPGAMVSVIGNAILKDLIVRKGYQDPGTILSLLDKELFFALNEGSSKTIRDGMDIALSRFDLKRDRVFYAGAFRPLVLVRDGEFFSFDGARFPIGFYSDVAKDFTSRSIRIKKGDAFYMFSDGYTDQFGGDKVKKFNRKRFKKLLAAIQGMPGGKQKEELKDSFENWKGKREQVDDVLVVGVLF